MKSKLLMGVVGLFVAVTMTISASAATLADEKCGCGGYIFWAIDWDDQQSEPFYAGPDCHATLYGAYGACLSCGSSYYGNIAVYDPHDYELNGNTLTCTVCGDSYPYN